MKKNIITSFISLILVFALGACDENEMFKDEMYKKLIYIVSDESQIFPLECNMETEESTVYFSIACSGSKHLDRDITVTFGHDSALYNKYNYSNYDIDTAKYIRLLDADKFNIPDYKATLTVDNPMSYVAVPIVIRPADLYGLSPDSMYVINLKLSGVSDYEINTLKDQVLCRVYFENKYARMKKPVTYSMKGYTQEEGDNKEVTANNPNKVIQPLTKNSVKMYVANTIPDSPDKLTPKYVNSYALEVTVNADNTLQISAYDKTNEWLEVEMLTPPDDPEFRYTNVYQEGYDQSTKMPAFLMYYKYRMKNDDGTWRRWITVKETSLRLKDPVEK